MIGGHPKILIIRLSAIGDVVRVLPAAHAIRRAYPAAQIDWVVEAAAADILQENPALDRVLVFDRGQGLVRSIVLFWLMMNKLRDQHYDIAIDFHGILKSGLLLAATRAKRRIGFAPPRAREQAHRFANEHTELSSAILNRVNENLELCNSICTVEASDPIDFEIDQRFNENVFRFIMDRRADKPWLVLVHAPVERPEKRWPADRFASLINLLHEDGRFDVLLTHGPGQGPMLTPILRGCQKQPILPPPCETLREFAGLAAMVSLYIGVDTGPMHIAAAVGTPVVAIFGGTDPKMHAPVGAPSITLGGVSLEQNTDRVPLAKAESVLDGVSPEEVFQSAVRLLGEVEAN